MTKQTAKMLEKYGGVEEFLDHFREQFKIHRGTDSTDVMVSFLKQFHGFDVDFEPRKLCRLDSENIKFIQTTVELFQAGYLNEAKIRRIIPEKTEAHF